MECLVHSPVQFLPIFIEFSPNLCTKLHLF
uniref:Uncharacterized protein n=1 Tax=Rhizophora mucronata TaxID=61149 RepID=A0A2P2PKY1_RHIMU